VCEDRGGPILRRIDERRNLLCLRYLLNISKMLVNIRDPDSRANMFEARVTELLEHGFQQANLPVIRGCKIGVAAFGTVGKISRAVPGEKGFTQACAWRDHGNRSLEDEILVGRLARDQVPLTMCPLSNLRLRVVADLAHHPLRRMMDKGLVVTVNSDDPAYFGGYVNQNYIAVSDALALNRDDVAAIVRNGIKASLMTLSEKDKVLAEVDRVLAEIA